MIGFRIIHWQRQVGVEFSEKKPATCPATDQVGMFADPAQACYLRDGFFQNRCGIHKGPVSELPHLPLNARGKLLKAVAHQFVVIPISLW